MAQKIPGRRNARLIVVYANDGDVSFQVDPLLNCSLKGKRMSFDEGPTRSLAGEIPCQCKSLVLSQILGPKELTSQVAELNGIEIQKRQSPNAFSNQPMPTFPAQSSTSDLYHVGSGQGLLISAWKTQEAIVDCLPVRPTGLEWLGEVTYRSERYGRGSCVHQPE